VLDHKGEERERERRGEDAEHARPAFSYLFERGHPISIKGRQGSTNGPPSCPRQGSTDKERKDAIQTNKGEVMPGHQIEV